MKLTRLAVVGCLALTVTAAELVWTRLFSAEFFYTFAFLILSIAIMGLGLGGLALRLVPAAYRPGTPAAALVVTAVAAVGSPVLMFRLGVDFSTLFASPAMAARFAVALLLLGSTFFFAGLALAAIYRAHHADMPSLYMADLMGAGAGVLAAVVAMNTIGTPDAVVWAAAPAALAALLESRRWHKMAPLAVLVALALLHGRLSFEVAREERAPVIYRHWDAMAKVKAYDYGGEARGINIDNVANTPVLRFDGDWDALAAEYPDGLPWLIDVGYLIDRFEDCRFLSLGCGGGWDVMQALEKGATEVHAVEVNPHIVRMLREGDPDGYVVADSSVVDSTGRIVTMADYSGHVFLDPRVTHVAEDARTYVRRHPGRFDVIFSLSSNTWAALGSGAFALAENYLFTTDAFRDYWNALSDSGFVSMEHQVYMPRLVTEAIAALESEGVASPREHIAVYNLPSLRRNVLLISKQPLTDAIRQNAYGTLTAETFGDRHLLYPAADSLRDNLVNQVVVNGWTAMQDSAAINLSPCSDDRPFIAQMGMWKNLDRGRLAELSKYAEFSGFPVSKLITAVILAVGVLLLIPLNLLPYLRRSGPRLRAAPWLYFFAIGVAFMAVEVVLIQRYTLFLGASSHSVVVILMALLVAGGLGSRVSARVPAAAAFAGIVLWLALEVSVFGSLTGRLAALPLDVRMGVTVALVFPLGFFMGMPFPRGALRVGELVDWGFAVNGAASVLGATGVVVAAQAFGFRASLMGAAAVYLAAFGLLSRRRAWATAARPGGRKEVGNDAQHAVYSAR